MPLPAGTKYRYKKGSNIRLAFAPGFNKVIEAKNMETGVTHTPVEFAADHKKRRAHYKR